MRRGFIAAAVVTALGAAYVSLQSTARCDQTRSDLDALRAKAALAMPGLAEASTPDAMLALVERRLWGAMVDDPNADFAHWAQTVPGWGVSR
jgi:hypothetical protein